MSYKTTQRISREKALVLLLSEIPTLPNDVLVDLLDTLAKSRQSRKVSMFDNFIVSNVGEEGA